MTSADRNRPSLWDENSGAIRWFTKLTLTEYGATFFPNADPRPFAHSPFPSLPHSRLRHWLPNLPRQPADPVTQQLFLLREGVEISIRVVPLISKIG